MSPIDSETLKTQLARLLVDACSDPSKPENVELLRFLVTVGVTANTFLRSGKTASNDGET